MSVKSWTINSYEAETGVEKSTFKVNQSHVLQFCRYEMRRHSLNCQSVNVHISCPDFRFLGHYLSQLTYNKMKRISFSPSHVIRLPRCSDMTVISEVANQSVLSSNCIHREGGPSNGGALPGSCSLWNFGYPISCHPWTGTHSTWPISSSVTATVPDLESEWHCRGQF